MKQKDLKKLALMGITGGIIAAAQAPISASEMNTAQGTILAGGCGSHGCSNTAYNERGNNQDYYSNYQDSSQAQHSCSGTSQSRGYQSNMNGWNNQNSNGWNGQNMEGWNGQNNNGWNGQNSNNWNNQNSNGMRGYTADNDSSSSADDDDSLGTSRTMSEEDFKAKLSPAAKADYDKLSVEGKAKALKMASHTCAGKNDCKGQNSCKSDKNECAGRGGCKGQSKCASTPDQAVKAASMQDKRASLNTNNRNSYSPR